MLQLSTGSGGAELGVQRRPFRVKSEAETCVSEKEVNGRKIICIGGGGGFLWLKLSFNTLMK